MRIPNVIMMIHIVAFIYAGSGLNAGLSVKFVGADVGARVGAIVGGAPVVGAVVLGHWQT